MDYKESTVSTYEEATDFLFRQLPMFSRVGGPAYKPGLERSLRLAEYFGNPHRRLRCIHIAGTNGKGSTSHLIAAVLQAAGYKTALYTSPHLVDFRERMRINGEMIPREEVTDFVRKWLASDYDGDRPSFFELTMMMAFDWFAREDVDYAVIEVGMGGRLDSTNIITPLLSVITNISFDHTQFLGDTLAKIASEKAGIIKPGIPAVIGEADAETEPIFRARAREVGAPMREAYREADPEIVRSFNCPLTGDYQQKNINTARIALDTLRQFVAISDEAIREGFAHVDTLTGLRGRWTILSQSPLTICDTGHNEAGLSYNVAQLKRLLNEHRDAHLHLVLGFVADKDVPHILDLFPRDAFYHFTQAAIPRALEVDKLQTIAAEHGITGYSQPRVIDAYHEALSQASPDDIIYIGGSTFVVADLLKDLM